MHNEEKSVFVGLSITGDPIPEHFNDGLAYRDGSVTVASLDAGPPSMPSRLPEMAKRNP